MCGMSGRGKLAAFLSGFWFAVNPKWSSHVSVGVGGRARRALGGRAGGDSFAAHRSGAGPSGTAGLRSLLHCHERPEPKTGARSPSWRAPKANASHLREH